jgi:hypothetical protein
MKDNQLFPAQIIAESSDFVRDTVNHALRHCFLSKERLMISETPDVMVSRVDPLLKLVTEEFCRKHGLNVQFRTYLWLSCWASITGTLTLNLGNQLGLACQTEITKEKLTPLEADPEKN